jgi:hypothetical protein
MEHHIKIKPNPSDYMRKEKKEEKNKRERRKKRDPRRKKRRASPAVGGAVASADPPRRKKLKPTAGRNSDPPRTPWKHHEGPAVGGNEGGRREGLAGLGLAGQIRPTTLATIF